MTYTPTEQDNHRIVTEALASASDDFSKFFDAIFAENVVWTLAGHGPVAGTYHGLKELFEKAENALFSRFAAPLKPMTCGVWADGDTVLAHIKSSTTALDGVPYNNEYSYIMHMQGGKVVSGIEWLDFNAYYAIIDRVQVDAG
jgi:ketosteroid isomerase-like protein